MTALAKHLEFAPPPQADGARSFGLALLVHLLLVAALTWGISWHDSDQSMAVEAELWSAIPTPAAPRAVEPEPPPPPQKAEPEPPPPPKVVPKPTPPAAQREAQLAIEREKQKKLEQEKKLEEERHKRKEKELKEKKEKEKLEKDKQAKLDKEKLEREKLEKEKLEKDKKDKQAKQKAEKAEQDAKERADAKRLEADRQANLKRMAGMAGATGGPTDTGTALKASGPSASYAGRIRGKVKPNIVFGDDIPGNPTAEVEVKCAPDGTILSKRLLQSSGHKAWDDAVIKALEKTEVLPRDTDGRVPAVLVISFRPKD